MKKNILITGATSPLGIFISKSLNQNPDNKLYLHGRNEKKLRELKSQCKGSEYIICDYSIGDDFNKFSEKIKNLTDKIDLMINNAFGQVENKITDDISFKTIDEFYTVSLAGTFKMVKILIPYLQKGINSTIINIVADWGIPMHNISTGPSIYISGKYGLHGLGVALQTEISKLGIKTTNIFPGAIDIDIKFEKSKSKSDSYELINPCEIVNTINFISDMKHAYLRTIVLTPSSPNYDGL